MLQAIDFALHQLGILVGLGQSLFQGGYVVFAVRLVLADAGDLLAQLEDDGGILLFARGVSVQLSLQVVEVVLGIGLAVHEFLESSLELSVDGVGVGAFGLLLEQRGLGAGQSGAGAG